MTVRMRTAATISSRLPPPTRGSRKSAPTFSTIPRIMPATTAPRDTVEATKNSDRQTFEKQKGQRLVDTLNLAPDDASCHSNNRRQCPGQSNAALDRNPDRPGRHVVVCDRPQFDTGPAAEKQHEGDKETERDTGTDEMDATDEDIAQEQWFIADPQLHRSGRPTPDRKRCAPQENVEAQCQHQDHDDRAARETAQRNTLDAKSQAEHDHRGKRDGQPKAADPRRAPEQGPHRPQPLSARPAPDWAPRTPCRSARGRLRKANIADPSGLR